MTPHLHIFQLFSPIGKPQVCLPSAIAYYRQKIRGVVCLTRHALYCWRAPLIRATAAILLTLGAHAQRGLPSVRVCVCGVCVSVTLNLTCRMFVGLTNDTGQRRSEISNSFL